MVATRSAGAQTRSTVASSRSNLGRDKSRPTGRAQDVVVEIVQSGCRASSVAQQTAASGRSDRVKTVTKIKTTKDSADHDKSSSVMKSPIPNRILLSGLPTPKTPSRKRRFELEITSADMVSEDAPDDGMGASRPLTPTTPRLAHNVFTRAKQAFSRSATMSRLVGRSKEKEALQDFLDKAFTSESANRCLYISGNPGTGKTALVTRMVEQMATRDNIQIVKINCVEVLSSQDIFGLLCQKLQIPASSSYTPQRALEAHLRADPSLKVIMLLDEIDHLLTGTFNHAALYEVFAWPFEYKQLCLVGIANALDLTQRFLPRLKVDKRCPQLMHFATYTISEITAILKDRLLQFKQTETLETFEDSATAANAATLPLFQNATLQLCAQKVASATGDLRKALDVCKTVIGMLEEESRVSFLRQAQLLQEYDEQSTPPSTPTKRSKTETKHSMLQPKSVHELARTKLAGLTCDTAPKATPVHVVKVCKAMFSSKAVEALRTAKVSVTGDDPTNTQRRLGGLSLQPRLVLLSLLLAREEGKLRGLEVQESRNGTSCGMKRSLSNISNSSSASSNSAIAGSDASFQTAFLRYQRLLKEHDIASPVTRSEFGDLITVLESSGLVTQAKTSASKSYNASPHLSLGLGESEIIEGLERIAIIGDLLKAEMAKIAKERSRSLLSLEWAKESKRLHLDQIQASQLTSEEADYMIGKKEHLEVVDPVEAGPGDPDASL